MQNTVTERLSADLMHVVHARGKFHEQIHLTATLTPGVRKRLELVVEVGEWVLNLCSQLIHAGTELLLALREDVARLAPVRDAELRVAEQVLALAKVLITDYASALGQYALLFCFDYLGVVKCKITSNSFSNVSR